ncbi:MAG: hypothetical protein IPM21_07430 [Acidobacteria bacterium]|nr:hypothetical protein [Acidobacteriota bacterium]
MTGTTAKIVLAIGATALFTSAVLIATFAGFLYFRKAPEPTVVTAPADGRKPPSVPAGPRKRGPAVVKADEIAEISLYRSSMRSTASTKPAAFFGNINVQNFISESSTLTFLASGTATKVEADERTDDGIKTFSGPTKYEVNIGRDAFARLAAVMAENDFANEPDSTNIISLPIRVELTVKYGSSTKLIKASNAGQDTLEMTAMLNAIDQLAGSTDWRAGRK